MKNTAKAAMPMSAMEKWRLAARPSGRPAQVPRTAPISESSHSTLSWSQVHISNATREPAPESTCRTKIASPTRPDTRKGQNENCCRQAAGFHAQALERFRATVAGRHDPRCASRLNAGRRQHEDDRAEQLHRLPHAELHPPAQVR